MTKSRPLRSRRWLSRYGRRLDQAWKRRVNGWQGDHRRWWEEGQTALWNESGEGVDESCPF